MAHIRLPEGLPGITAGIAFRPETGVPFRYVDGLVTWTPDDPRFYRNRAAKIVQDRYIASTVQPAARQ
jgi:hypothetical protein